MATKKKDLEKLATVRTEAKTVVIWQAKRPLNDEQYEAISERLRREQENVGVEIMLVPHSVDVEITSRLELQTVETSQEQEQAAASNDEPKPPAEKTENNPKTETKTSPEKTDEKSKTDAKDESGAGENK